MSRPTFPKAGGRQSTEASPAVTKARRCRALPLIASHRPQEGQIQTPRAGCTNHHPQRRMDATSGGTPAATKAWPSRIMLITTTATREASAQHHPCKAAGLTLPHCTLSERASFKPAGCESKRYSPQVIMTKCGGYQLPHTWPHCTIHFQIRPTAAKVQQAGGQFHPTRCGARASSRVMPEAAQCRQITLSRNACKK